MKKKKIFLRLLWHKLHLRNFNAKNLSSFHGITEVKITMIDLVNPTKSCSITAQNKWWIRKASWCLKRTRFIFGKNLIVVASVNAWMFYICWGMSEPDFHETGNSITVLLFKNQLKVQVPLILLFYKNRDDSECGCLCPNSGKPKEFQILSSCLSGYIAQKKWRTTVWRLVVSKEKRRSLRAEKRHTYTCFDGKTRTI